MTSGDQSAYDPGRLGLSKPRIRVDAAEDTSGFGSSRLLNQKLHQENLSFCFVRAYRLHCCEVAARHLPDQIERRRKKRITRSVGCPEFAQLLSEFPLSQTHVSEPPVHDSVVG